MQLPKVGGRRRAVLNVLGAISTIVSTLILNSPDESWDNAKHIGDTLRDNPGATIALAISLVVLIYANWEWLWGLFFETKRWRNDRDLEHQLYDWMREKDFRMSDVPILKPAEVAFAFAANDANTKRNYNIVKIKGQQVIGIKVALVPVDSAETVKKMTAYEVVDMKADLALELTRHGLAYAIHHDFLMGGVEVIDEVPIPELTQNRWYQHFDRVSRALVMGQLVVGRHVARAKRERNEPLSTEIPQSTPDKEDFPNEPAS